MSTKTTSARLESFGTSLGKGRAFVNKYRKSGTVKAKLYEDFSRVIPGWVPNRWDYKFIVSRFNNLAFI